MVIKKRNLCISVISLIALIACTAPETFDKPSNYEKAKKSFMGDTLLKAMSSYLNDYDDRHNRTSRRAVVGDRADTLIINWLNKQEAYLRKEMGNENIVIQNTGERLIVTLPQDVLFAIDSISLRSDLLADLSALSINLKRYPDTNIQVIGHTDNTGYANYNLMLSMEQAKSVSKFLIINGIASSRIISIGRGENQPTSSNLTSQGRVQNRRIEIVILPSALTG